MPAKRDYRVKGTKDFLVLAFIFFFLCLWAIKDAWFPGEKVMKKHPMEITVAFEIPGTVERVNVGEGDSVAEQMVLAKLRSDRISVEYDEAKEAYTAAREAHAALRQGGDAQALSEAQQTMDDAEKKVKKLLETLDSCELKSPGKGAIKDVRIAQHSVVEADETAFVIDPKDHFYLFNKSLAIFSFIMFWVFLAVHILGQ